MSERKDRRSEGREPDERLADWVDGRMSPRDRERFAAELRVNPELKRDLEQYERTVGVLRAALRAPTAPSRSPMADRVFAAIANERAAPAAPRRTGFSWPHAWWSLATAAALLACTFWLSVWSGSSATPQTSTQASRDADDALGRGQALVAGGDRRPDAAPAPQGALPPADPASRAKDLAVLRLEDKKESPVAGNDKPGESGAALAEQEHAAVTTATVPSVHAPAPTVVPPVHPFRTGESAPTPDAGVGNPPTPGGGGNPGPGPADAVPGSTGGPGQASQFRESLDGHAGPATPGPAGPSTGGPGGTKATGPGAAAPTPPSASSGGPGAPPAAPAEVRTGSDDFYLGATRRQVPAAEKAQVGEKAQAPEDSAAERAKAAGGKADATPAPKPEGLRLESASVARLPFVEVHAVLPKPAAAGSHDSEGEKSKSDGGQARSGGRGSPPQSFERDTLAATGAASAPLDGEALRASLEQFLAGAVSPSTVPAAVQWRTKRGEMSASPWMAEHESGKDRGRLADEPQAERRRTTPSVEERVWLIEGEREDVALLLSRMAELGRARKWEMRSGEMPAPANLAKNPEVPGAAPVTGGGGGGGGEAASRGLAGAAKPGGDTMRVVLRIRLSAR